MKKLIVGLIISTLPVLALVAQNLPFTQGFIKIIDDVPNKFSTYKGSSTRTEGNKTYYSSGLTISDADKTEIYFSDNKYTFYVVFGTFSTKSEAVNRMESILSNIASAWQNEEFIRGTFLFSDNPYCVFRENFPNGFIVYPGNLGISKSGENYQVFFSVVDNDEKKTYQYIPNQPDTSSFSRDFRYIVDEARNGFKNILGEKMESFFLTEYKSTRCLESSYECKIIDITLSKSFEAYFAYSIEMDMAKKGVENLGGYVAAALGDSYVYCIIKNGKGFEFKHKSDILTSKQPAIKVEMKEKNGKYDVLIEIEQPLGF